MRRTQKYSKACEVLTFPHSTQDELYSELNRLGWFWSGKKKVWERDDRLAQPASKLIKLRVWGNGEIVDELADGIVEAVTDIGLKLLEKSKAYPCRPPQQNDSRVYLTFEDVDPGEQF